MVGGMPTQSFAALLRKLKKQYPTVKAFAQALDVDPSHVSRAMNDDALPFDVRGCLRLALVTGENPGMVLRIAGKGEIAGLIEQLYGAPTKRLSSRELELLKVFHRIARRDVQRSLIEVARAAGLARGIRRSTVPPAIAREDDAADARKTS